MDFAGTSQKTLYLFVVVFIRRFVNACDECNEGRQEESK